MKVKVRFIAGAALAVWSLGGISAVQAQGPRGGTRLPSGGEAELPTTGPEGLADLGKAADRFEAWRIAKLDGAETFSKSDEEVREEYQKLISKIVKSTLEDRLEGEKARFFISDALKIAALGASVSDKLKALEAEVDSAITDSAKAETLTPRLNRLQWLIGETLMYGSYANEFSDAKISSIDKKLIALEEKEAKAKEDGKLTDLERERLDEGASKIWRLIVRDLKGRDD